ncbi:SH3 domain-binding glutamic acid-rich-like protein 2 [Ciona intestinalis]
MGIVVYTTSCYTKTHIRDQQIKVLQFIEVNNIDAEIIDLTMNTSARDIMLESMPKEKTKDGAQILPPQIFSNDEYCGDYEEFFLAMENMTPFSFFKLDPPPGSFEEKLIAKRKNAA